MALLYSRDARALLSALWTKRLPTYAILVPFAAAMPILDLPSALAWLRIPAYVVAVILVAMIGWEAWRLKSLLSRFQSGIEFASSQRSFKAEARIAQTVHTDMPSFSTMRALGLSVITSLSCVAAIVGLLTSLFYGLAFRDHIYDPVGISSHSYAAIFFCILDNAMLRGFFAFLSVLDEWANIHLPLARELPEKVKLLSYDWAFAAALAAMRFYANSVFLGLIFVIGNILMLRRRFGYLFVEEQRQHMMKA